MQLQILSEWSDLSASFTHLYVELAPNHRIIQEEPGLNRATVHHASQPAVCLPAGKLSISATD